MSRWFGLLLACALAAPAAAQDANREGAEDPERQFLEAWFALENPAQRERADAVFRALAGRADVGEKLRIRAEIAIARVDELNGKQADARRRLEELVPRTRELPELRGVVVERLGQPRWFHAIRTVTNYFQAPRYLDLDNGGLFASAEPHPRGGPEMNGTSFLVETEVDEAFGRAVPPMSSKPWHRLRTDEGNLCWVQILATAPQPVVRFITRVGGYGDVLPAPREPFCIGYNSKIEVWWHPDAAYAKYRVERRTGVDEEWQAVREFEQPPFIDREVRVGERYGYRITGITKGEVAGLPVSLQGTVRSRGVVSGRVELGNQTKFDFLVGDTVNAGFDIRVYNVWQQAAVIHSYLNAPVTPLSLAPGVAEPLSPWDTVGGGNGQIQSGDVFLVPLNGGGVARCQLTIKRSSNRNQFVAVLDYDAFGDADIFPEPPRLTAEETAEGVRLRATVAPPYQLAEAQVREVISRKGPWTIPLDEKGEGLDTRATGHDLREYTAVAVDAHGRRTLAGRALVVRMPDEPVAGEFKFRYQQGYSIVERAPAMVHEADIFFQAAQRNIDRISFHSNFGIAHVRGALDWDTSDVTEEEIFERIAGVDESKISFQKGYLWTNQAQKGENVLLLRTKYGGWAKLWIADRETSGSWNQRDITVKYVYNARAPRFVDGEPKLTEKNGVLFTGLERIEEYSRVTKEWKESWNKLWQDESFKTRMLEIEPGGGDVADADELQEVLLEENEFKSLETARYSFSLGRRDRPDKEVGNEAWDIKWHGDSFYTGLSKEDQSTLTDLGRMHWMRLVDARQLVPSSGRSARVRVGHVYLFRKRMGETAGPTTLFRVIGLEPRKRLQIEWVSLDGEELRAAPALGLDAAGLDRLKRLLASAPADANAREAALGGAAAARTFGRLHAKKLPSVARKEARLSEFMPEFALLSGLEFVLEGDIGTRTVAILRPAAVARELLSDVADAAGLEWRIDEEGRIRLRPSVLSEAEQREIAEAAKRRKVRLEEERKRRLEEERKRRLEELGDVREALQRAIVELESRGEDGK